MAYSDLARLLLLAAIWGGSFIFMRILAPVLGPVCTASVRLLIGGSFLVIYFALTKFPLQWRQFWRQYLVIGILNSAVPFALYAFAAIHIPASYSVILNSTSPLFGALLSAFWLGEKFTLKKGLGLGCGALGVILIAGVGPVQVTSFTFSAVIACLTGSMSYALTGVYIKKYAQGIKPFALAGASQLLAGLVLVPLLPIIPPRLEITPLIIGSMLGLSLLGSALAYLLYFRLIENLGPTKALTVTFLMPVFGIIWSVLFLREQLTAFMVLGCALILLGTSLVLNLISLPHAPIKE